jgi:Short C-terminal domain
VGLKDLFKGGEEMGDPVRGTAQVVSATMHHGRGIYQVCEMQLVVQADGVPATAVAFGGLVHRDRWPFPGAVLPVTVDRAEPHNVTIEWDEVASAKDRSRQSAESLAAMMRGDPSATPVGGQGGAGMPMVVNVSGTELDQLSEEQKAKLRIFGIDADAVAAEEPADEAPSSPPETVIPPPPSDETEARLDLLERLVMLRQQGALTDEEFEAQKRRILGG